MHRSIFAFSVLLMTADIRAADLPLMPMPASVATQAGYLPITTEFSVSVAGAGAYDSRVLTSVQRLFAQIARQTGIPLLPKVVPNGGTLQIVVESRDHRGPQRLGDDERYSLQITAAGVRLSADAPLGALRGMETFLQLIQQNTSEATPPAQPGFSAPFITIRDEPRFPWRGLSLDVSRHFLPVDVVKRNIDGLAAVKLNVLHWHLSDDQGFRIQSKRYPRLQQYGSDGLYYTQDEVKDIIAYARDRGVRIVPEFDMPGHATSWLPGYPALAAREGTFQIGRGYGILSDLMDPTKESTYRFLNNFVGEMVKLFPDEYFHIGGDEVSPEQWNNNPRIRAFMRKHHIPNAVQLQVYFNQRLFKIVTHHGKRMVGWDEVLQPNLPKTVVVESWRGQKSLWQAAREGYGGFLAHGYYLDLMQPASQHYEVDPLKGADLTPDQQKLILGGEAAMWEELADAENVDSRLWPRLAAIAERLWSPESVTDVASMYRRLAVVNQWLEWFGLTQRTNLELMRQRLAGEDVRKLDIFAAILEPVKGYERHAQKNTNETPLNRLVDAISPESDAAREFRLATSAYLRHETGHESSDSLRERLQTWQHNAEQVRPVLQSHSLLNEDLPVADAITTLCTDGLQALDYLDGHKPATADWKQQTTAAVAAAGQRQGDLLIQIAPAVQDLINAVQTQ